MGTKRALATSFVVTLGVACGPATPTTQSPDPEPVVVTRNPPMPTPDPEPVEVDGVEESTETGTGGGDAEPALAAAPNLRGEITRSDEGACFWRTTARANPPPPAREVLCPPVLEERAGDPLVGTVVRTSTDGTCSYEERSPAPKCPQGMACNPPAPRAVETPCAPAK